MKIRGIETKYGLRKTFLIITEKNTEEDIVFKELNFMMTSEDYIPRR